MPLLPKSDTIQIREVWNYNLEKEFTLIRDIVDDYPYIAMDTKFSGIVLRPVGNFKNSYDYHYQTLKDNVDMLKLIQLGLEEEGLQVYVAYLKKVIGMRSRLEFEQCVELMEQRNVNSNNGGINQNQVNFVGCLTNLFKDIVLAIEENDEILRSLCGEDGIVYAICELQEECDSRGSLILKKQEVECIIII